MKCVQLIKRVRMITGFIPDSHDYFGKDYQYPCRPNSFARLDNGRPRHFRKLVHCQMNSLVKNDERKIILPCDKFYLRVIPCLTLYNTTLEPLQPLRIQGVYRFKAPKLMDYCYKGLKVQEFNTGNFNANLQTYPHPQYFVLTTSAGNVPVYCTTPDSKKLMK